MVAYSEAQELTERVGAGEKLTSSCCPAFVNLVRKHFPDLMKYVSTTVSPMVAVERYIRSLRPDVVTVFIGPCIAKKNEVMGSYVDEIDYALTFEELYAMMCAKGVEDITGDEEEYPEDATRYGKGFALSGGVTGAVNRVLEERGEKVDVKALKCNGAEECRKALMLLKAGRLPENFVEGMFCVGGCMGGPATLNELQKSKKVFESRLDGADSVVQNVEGKQLNKADIHRHN